MLSPLALLCVAAVATAVAPHRNGPLPRERGVDTKKHVIFIVADDLGFDDVGFRSHQIKTPTIDGLAEEGVVLNRYYVQDVCSPSRAAMLTGRYPLHTGIDSWIEMPSAYGLPLNETTMADHFLRAGYATHAVGKWHLGFFKWAYTPTFRGFQSFYGFYGGGEDYFTHQSSGAYDLRRDPTPRCGKGCSQVAWQDNGKYTTELFAAEAQRIIADHDVRQPLFLYLPFQAVHSPAQVPQHYVDPYNTTIEDHQRRVFAGMLSCLDEAIGNVTSALKQRGMYNDSVIVFTTDNGGPVITGDAVGARNWPLRGGKHSVWEGGVRGTALMWTSDLATKGTEYQGLMHTVDWLPTLLEATGQPAPAGLDGVTQWQALSQGQADARDHVYCGLDQTYLHRALRNETWKLLLAPRGTPAGGDPSAWVPPVNQSLSSAHAAASAHPHAPALPRSLALGDGEDAPASCVRKAGTCFPNNDLVRANVSSAAECCGLCAQTHKCVLWTFRDNQQPSCYLKSAVGNVLLDAHCVSGFPITADSTHLFDLSTDPTEHNDVAAQYPAVVSSLLEALLAEEQTGSATATDDPACATPVHPVDPHVGPVWEPWC